jgi:peptidoglycan/xylan/chitin deacetylase (PgdA/CDA1 family)
MTKLILKTVILAILGLGIILPSFSISTASRTKVWYRDQVAVIMYHHVHDLAKSSSTITTALFSDQLNYLLAEGYQFITLRQFKDFLQGATVPNNAVLVTFDDGYESFYENAYPILKRLRIPAVNFVITKDLENPLASYIPSLSRDEIVEMTHDTNFIDAQCHTHALHDKAPSGEPLLTARLEKDGKKETAEEYRQRIYSDTQACINSLKDLYSEPIDSLAYPFGMYNKEAAQIVHDAGIRYAFTIVPEMATRDVDPLAIPRINAGSPWITPEGLHNSIIRRVVATGRPFSQIKLQEAVSQLGGSVVQERNGTLRIAFRGKTWSARLNSPEVVTADGIRKTTLTRPIVPKDGTAMISMDDLQTLLGVPIMYNPNTGKFSTRITPNAAK